MRLESCHLKILSLLRLKNHPKTKKKKKGHFTSKRLYTKQIGRNGGSCVFHWMNWIAYVLVAAQLHTLLHHLGGGQDEAEGLVRHDCGWVDFWHFCHIDFMTHFPKVFLGLGLMILDVYQVWNPMGNSESPLGRKRACQHFHQMLMRCLPSSHPWSCLSEDKQSQPVVLCIQLPITERMSGCPGQCWPRSLEKRQNKSVSSIFEDLADQRWAKDFSSFNKQSPRALTSIGVRMASWHSVALAP